MDKAFLLGSLFVRLSSIYGSATHGDLMGRKSRRSTNRRKRTPEEDRLEKAPWKVELLVPAGRDDNHRKAA